MRRREARTENTLAFFEASRSVWLQRGQKVCILQPGCPRIALASCPARAAHRLTDHPSVRRQCLSFLRQPELSAPVGGRALGLLSEGSWLAAELLRAGLEPGAVDRRAGWTGLCPSSPVPKVRPRPPARHAAASARAHIHPARPCAPWAILVPHCITTQSSCVPGFAQVSTRAFEQGAVRQWGTSFCVENGV